MKRIHLVAVAALTALGGCATTASRATLADTDKAIISADVSYHVAADAAAVLVRGGVSPATRAAIDAANDKAAAALHDAYKLRTSAAVTIAVAAIADFSKLTGGK